MSDDEQGYGRSTLATLATGSSAVLTGIPLAVPGVLLVWYLAPSQVGYYLIAFLAGASQATLRRLSSDDAKVDLSGRTDGEIRRLLVLLVILGTLSVSVRLLLGTAGAFLVQTTLGQTGVSVLVAVVVPLADRRLADASPWLSPSGASGSLVLCVVNRTEGGWFERESDVADAFERQRGRFGPI